MTTHITIIMTRDEAKQICVDLERLGCIAHGAHVGKKRPDFDWPGPVSGWLFAHLLQTLRLQTTGVDHVDDFGEDGGS